MLINKELDDEINHILKRLQKEAQKEGMSNDTFEQTYEFKSLLNELYTFNYDGSAKSKVKLLELQLNLSNSILKYMFNFIKEPNNLINDIWYLNWLIERIFIDIKIDTAVNNIDDETKNNFVKKYMPN